MKKNFLFLSLVATMLLTPLAAFSTENATKENVEEELNEIAIVVKDKQVHITNADGKTLEVYNLTGMCVATIKIEGENVSFNLNLAKGYYILKIGKIARKISIS